MPTDTKNKGSLLVSYGAGDLNAIPIEWRARMGFRQEDQQVPLGFTLPTNGDEPPDPVPVTIVEDRLIQTRTDERKRTSVVLNPPPPNGGTDPPPGGGPPGSWTMVSEERVPWGQVATRTRAFVPLGSHLVLTDEMLQAEQKNLGMALDQVVLTAPLPGPNIVDTKFDETASLISTTKTRRLVSQITDGENIIGNLWTQTTREGETATVASQVVMSRTLPGATIESTEYDPQSVLVITKTTKKQASQITDGETIIGGVWKRIHHKGETGLVASEIEESRTLPGPTIPSTRFDNDSVLVTINKTKKVTESITEGEVVTPTLWTKTYGDGETGLISTEIVESRGLPGPAIVSSRFDNDNTLVTIIKTQKKSDQFADGETIQGSTWTRTTREGITGNVATEVKEARTVPGPAIVGYRLDPDGAVVTVTKTKKLIGQIAEGETATPTLWTRIFTEDENLLIATEVKEERFLGAAAPSVTTSHYDEDNTLVTITKTKKKFDQFNDTETYDPQTQIWKRITREGISELVVEEVVESRHLPGDPVKSYRLDEDGATVTVIKTKKLLDDIAYGEFATNVLWTRTTAEGKTLLFATEVIETRALGGPTVESYRIDEDGAVVTVKKTKKFFTNITEAEASTTVLWTKIFAEPVTAKVANEVVETRPLGVNAPTVPSSRLDRDGLIINVTKVKVKTDPAFNPSETGNASSWIKTYRESVDAFVSTHVVETAVLPGPSVISTKLEDDGRFTTITKQRKFFSDVTTSESINANQWIKVYKEGESGKLATQVTEQRGIAPVPANTVPSAHVDQNLNVVSVTKATKAKVDITPSVNLGGGIITTVEQKELTELVSEEIKSVVPAFDPAKYGKSIENPLPGQFRSLGVVLEEVHVIAGQAAVPVLGNNLEVSQEQINTKQKRVATKGFDIAALPVTYAGKELTTEFGGVLLNTAKTLALFNDSNVDIVAADALVTSLARARIERYGGYKVKDSATVQGAFPIIDGGNVDPEFPFVYNFTEQVVNPNPPTGVRPHATVGLATMTEIKPLDAARSLRRITSIQNDNLAGSVQKFKLQFPGTTDVSIPPQLVSVTGVNNGTGGGAGSYSEGGTYTIVNQGSGQMRQDAKANSSAHAMMDMNYTVKQVWGQNIKCIHYLFFVAGPVVTYDTVLTKLKSADIANDSTIAVWPRFQPQGVNLVIVGAKMTTEAKATKWYSDTITADYLGRPTRGGSGRSGGSGTSQEVDIMVKTITIPPTIHAALTIATNSASSGNYSASASVTSPSAIVAAANSAVGSHIYPTTIGVTGGQSTIPTAGKFVHRMKVEPWKLNYFKCDCEVVNAAEW